MKTDNLRFLVVAFLVFSFIPVSIAASYIQDRFEEQYLLEMGVPRCVVFDYDCELVKEGGSDG